MKNWYLLYCKPRSEVRAQQNLRLQHLESYFPVIRMETKKSGNTVIRHWPMFPNYLFVKFDPVETSIRQLHSTRGVIRLVDCREKLQPIDEQIIQRLKQQEKVSEPIKKKVLAQGDKICFDDGPFAGLQGIFQEKSGDQRCFILFEILGYSQRVEVSESVVKLVTVN